MNHVKKHKLLAGTVGSLALLIVFLVSTSPSEDNLVISFIPLILLWVFVYFASGFVAHDLLRRGRSAAIGLMRVSTASSAMLIVMFSALGQLSIVDVVALIALSVLGTFYFNRTWQQ